MAGSVVSAKWVPWACACVALVVYSVTLHPGVPGGDAGELMAAACAGGVAHPPGYPLHGLLSRVALLLPFGSPLVRLNFVSAFVGAIAVGLLADVLRRWARRAEAGVLAAACWLASPLPWTYSTSTEVFALHVCLLAWFTWALTRDVLGAREVTAQKVDRRAPSQPPRAFFDRLSSSMGFGAAALDAQPDEPAAREAARRSAWWLGVIAGLAVTHHQTAVFFVGPLLALRAWSHPHRTRIAAGLVIGFAPLLLLPWWSGTDTPFSWGDLRTPAGFVTHLLRREYGTFQLAADREGNGLVDFLGAFFTFEWKQLYALVAFFALVGFLQVIRFARARLWLTGAGLVLALSLLVFGSLANLPVHEPLFRGVVERFFLMPHLIICACAGMAVDWLPRPRVALAVAASLLVLGFSHRPRHDDSVERYGRQLLAQPEGALVLTQGDLIGNSTRALQACLKERPELRVVDQQLLTYDWYVPRLKKVMPELVLPGSRWHPRDAGAFTLQQLMMGNASRPIVVCGGLKPGDGTNFRAVPWGFCERYFPPDAPFDEEAWWGESARVLPPFEGTRSDAEPGTWEEVVRRDVWQARAQRGLFALNVAIGRGNDPTWLERSYAVLKEVAERDEAPQAATFKNLGIAAGRLGRKQEMRAAFKKYVALAPASDPELAAIRGLVEER